ncbi:MAG: FAD synthetase family protein [Amoebophilaceae bacterium]|jgi:riboflavin kinase/FMN adenylyltransferase|nr:FAD synthetase family protein [Amoebophilaceae bacterium]
MRVYESIEAFQKLDKAIVSMGTFDGVHWGHQQLLRRLRAQARAVGGETVIITFWPHPNLILAPLAPAPIQLLTTSEEKINILKELGIDHCINIKFTKALSRLSAKNFVQQVLVSQVGVKKLIIGHDHRFGKGRAGNLALLQAEGQCHNFTVEEMSPQIVDTITISSTKIRQLLLEGDVEKAHAYLGYPYEIGCTMMCAATYHARHLHVRLIAANSHKLIPSDGRYRVQVVHQNLDEEGRLYIRRCNGVPTIELSVPTFLSVTSQTPDLRIIFKKNLH